MQGNDTPPAVLKTANRSLAVERSCEVCGETFLAMKVRAERGQARFCSRPCSGQSRNRHVECTCLMCGKTFEIKASAQARGEGIYCTPACYRAATAGVERVPLAERFWAKVNKHGPIPEHRPELGPCWVWTAYRMKTPGFDYGVIQTLDGTELAHRVSYRLNIGPLTLDVLHKCDNPPCVRPEHLFEGDDGDNQRDAAIKDRKSIKLTNDDVREMRRLHADGAPEAALVARFGVSRTTVFQVVNHLRRYHVD